jgi:16S rRNA (cytosine967-C5)-methyltransferase
LVRVEAGAYASLTLSGEMDRARLDDAARGLCTELVYGSLRKRALLDAALSRLAPRGLATLDPQVRVLLRLGAYQLLFTRVPPARAVNQVVTALRALRGPGLAGFANALLRRLAREGLPPVPVLPDDASADQVCAALVRQHGLPAFVVEDLLALLGRAGTEALCVALDQPAPTWLRLNALRGSFDDARAALLREGIALHTGHAADAEDATDRAVGEHAIHAALPEAVRLRAGYPFAGAAYADGWFTAQDLGAQLVARLLVADDAAGQATQLPDGAVLDACCGTGGKATHLAALLTGRGSPRPIDAADRSLRKLDLCREHIQRLRCRDVHPLQLDLLNREVMAAALRPHYAAILLDAPCSGSGVLRRHPEARTRLQASDVHALAAAQRRMLGGLLPHLSIGGVVVYAVCSPLREEGPEVLAAILREHPELSPLPPPVAQAPWGEVYQPTAGLYTWPHAHNADSFYAIRLRRTR